MTQLSAVDLTTGSLTIQQPPVVVGSDLTRTRFTALPLGMERRGLHEAAPWSLFRIPAALVGGEHFSVTLCFHEERLDYVTLTCGRPEFGVGLAALSTEQEQARQRCHNDWLHRHLAGRPGTLSQGPDAPTWVWSFPWGRIVSGWDVKNGTTDIVIRYR